jgi:hypothetical protein
MKHRDLEHPVEDILERYLIRHALAGEVAVVETHLLICDSCRKCLDELEEYRSVIREGFAQLETEHEKQARSAAVPVRVHQFRDPMKRSLNLALPRWSWMPTAVVFAFIVILAMPAMRPSANTLEVSLTAERGSDTNRFVVPSGRDFLLYLDSAGLPVGRVLVEIVDDNGGKVNQQQSSADSNRVTTAEPPLAKGTYYVRLYVSNDSQPSPDRLLREFVLQVR